MKYAQLKWYSLFNTCFISNLYINKIGILFGFWIFTTGLYLWEYFPYNHEEKCPGTVNIKVIRFQIKSL